MRSNIAREAEIARIAESDEVRERLRQHVEEIVEGPAFRGSARSRQFLRYILEEAIAGNFSSLKERVIGVALFGRSPSYATGEDAIVRVTANDVRKRLLQHYDRRGAASEFHIHLPAGSYLPEVEYTHQPTERALDPVAAGGVHPLAVSASPAAARQVSEPRVYEAFAAISDPADPETARSGNPSRPRRLSPASLFVAMNLVLSGILLYGIIWVRSSRTEAAAASVHPTQPISVLPWSVFFGSGTPLHLITSDPDIYWIQTIAHTSISAADYANRIYVPEHNALSPEMKQFCLHTLSGDKAATTDTRFAADAGALAERSSRRIDVQGARNLQFSGLKNDDNFIFLGSPRSDPWVSLFDDQLDFRFVLGKGGLENIWNVHPRQDEQPLYVPAGGGEATRQSFAIIAFVQNPDQYGHVLLLAGISGEGTQAAGKLITDIPRFSTELRKCGITSSSPIRHFEMLLSVTSMAGSPSEASVLACHILGTSVH
jgi:hypothetical protein